MESTRILVGILGLQITIAAGLLELIEHVAVSAEGFWVMVMFVGIGLTGFAVATDLLN
ncbi:hypothetical protein [Halobiforma nitratireducens]|uniref:hypothetical protein n=1 Tax=Halobiforma nitratireducens TaxID=130048 RepID=UPI001461338B|nr:hypothetical protein [Halobiforma nitratireducens]